MTAATADRSYRNRCFRGAEPSLLENRNRHASRCDNETLYLIRACKKGDTDAWDRLVHRYQPLLYRFAYSFCHNSDDSSDIVAQVLMRLYRGLATFHETASFSYWLLRITRNTFLDLCIRPRHHADLSLDTDLAGDGEHADRFNFPDPSPLPEEQCLSRALREEVVCAVRHLPEHQRRLLQLYYTEQKSYIEIAGETGLALGTVKSRLNRARHYLRERLAASNAK